MDWQHECEVELIKTYLEQESDLVVANWCGIPIERFSRTALLGMVIELNRMQVRQSAQYERDLDFLRDCGDARIKLGGE